MTFWRYPVSWSKLQMAFPEACQLRLKYTIEKKPIAYSTPNMYARLGNIVQFVFEQYYNQGINRKRKGRTEAVIMKVAERIWNSKWRTEMEITYPPTKTENDLYLMVMNDVIGGFREMVRMNMLTKPVESERKWGATFRGFRTYAQMDFCWEGESGWWILDGKGHKNTNADPRQIQYYALTLVASSKKIAGGGLLYWKHGIKPVKVDPTALKKFVDEDFTPAAEVFARLKMGTDDLPANPSPKNCGYCGWRTVCDQSYYKKDRQDVREPGLVTFGAAN